MNLTASQMNQIKAAIAMAAPEQLRELEAAVRNTRKKVALSNLELTIGARVRFKPRKTKPTVEGTVERINSKTVTVVDCTDGGPGWRVPAEVLTVI